MSGQETKPYEGSCACGRVRYRASAPFGVMSHCHCTDCRKSHGAAFATYIGLARERFTLVNGSEDLAGWTAEPGTRREFCRTCGSNIICTVKSEPGMVYVAAATFDTPLDRKPEYHIFVRSRVPWYEIKDGLPQHQEYEKA